MTNNEQIQVQPASQQTSTAVHPFLAAQGNKIKGQVDDNFKNEMKRRAEEIKQKEIVMRQALEQNLKNMFHNKMEEQSRKQTPTKSNHVHGLVDFMP